MICTLLRKPLTGTIIETLVEFQGGGMNIDACRVGCSDVFSVNSGSTSGLCGTNEVWTKPWKIDLEGLARRAAAVEMAVIKANTLGRYPANVVVHVRVIGAFPDVVGATSRTGSLYIAGQSLGLGLQSSGAGTVYQDDTLSASRFFKNLVK